MLEKKSNELTRTKQELEEATSLNKNLTEQLNLCNKSISEVKRINNALYIENDNLISKAQKLRH